ncbi:MAG TPA: glutaredoxin family protein [Pirellulales bacterium]|jgi:glutaredoxin|nr:glutaredoxin family protein [Pirellulales bacterium]
MTEPEIILYTRLGCHLCDDAKSMLESHRLAVKCVDIDTDPALVERFGLCVPVVFIDGRERFRGRIDPVLLRRLLKRH